jgi:hypothetical protein
MLLIKLTKLHKISFVHQFTLVNSNAVPPDAIPNPMAMNRQKIPSNVPRTDPSNCLMAKMSPMVPPLSTPNYLKLFSRCL